MADRTVKISITGSSAGASKAFQQLQDAASKAGIKISEATDKTAKAAGGSFGSLAKNVLALGGAYLSFSAVSSVIGKATAAFGDQQVATTLLNQAMADTGQKWTPALTAAFNSTADSMLKFGDNTAEVTGGVQKLILAGVPASAAIKDMSTVANFAAATHTTLAAAIQTVAAAANGRMTPALKELGVTALPKGVHGVQALNDILGQLTPKVTGAADAVSHTMPGALAAFGATITDKVLVPVGALINKGLVVIAAWVSQHSADISGVLTGAMKGLGTVVQVVADVFGFLAKNWNLLGPIILATGAALVTYPVAMGVVNTVTKLAAAAQAVFNLVMDANPVGIAVLALAALAAAVVVVITHFSFFKTIALDVWNSIKGVVIPIWNTLVGLFKVTPFGLLITHLTEIKDFFATIFGAIVAGVRIAIGVVGSIVGGVASGIATGVKGIINTVIGVLNFFIGVIDTVIGGMNAVLGSIPTFGAGKIHIGTIGKIPTLDTGGIVTKPTLAFLAMNSRPEAVVPLGSPLPGGSGGGTTNYITVNVNGGDPVQVVNALKRYMYSTGPLPLTVNAARRLGNA